jgi:hypothetical protein
MKELISKRWQAFPCSYEKEHNTFGLGFPRGYLKIGITVHKRFFFI